MKIVCEICGGSVFEKQGSSFVCKSCGTSYSNKEVKKLMVDDGKEVLNSDSIGDSTNAGRFEELIRLGCNYLDVGDNDKAYDTFIQAKAIYDFDDKHWTIDGLANLMLVENNRINTECSNAEYAGNVVTNLTEWFNVIENNVELNSKNKVQDIIDLYCDYYKPLFNNYFDILQKLYNQNITGKQIYKNYKQAENESSTSRITRVVNPTGELVGDLLVRFMAGSGAKKQNKETQLDSATAAKVLAEFNNDLANEMINFASGKKKPSDFDETMIVIANNTIGYLEMLDFQDDTKSKLIKDAEQIKQNFM